MLFSKETGGLGDQRKFIRITKRFITCLYRIQFEKKIDVFPILSVQRISSITKEMIQNQGIRVKATQFLFYMDFR